MKLMLPMLTLLCFGAGAKGKPTMPPVAPDAVVEKIQGDFQFTEGPVWNPAGFLLFSDTPANTIYRYTPGGRAAIFRRPSSHSNGMTYDARARLIVCETDRRVTRTEKNGTLTLLADRYEGKRLNSPNDVVVRASDQAVYFTDPPYGTPKGEKELDFSGVYRWRDGVLTLLGSDFDHPNGLAFSPDQKRLYIDDTPRMHIRVFTVQPDGTLARGRLFAELKEKGKQGAPDGMKVDTQGNVYCTGPGGVWVFAPDGTLLTKIPVPEVACNVAFGDADAKTLYITAIHGLYKIRLNIPGIQPLHPMVF